ncbi:MAG: hypothetical protein IVW54_07990 [Candidatus Binataceae bacterium]|nr:hypothetical protein [Candidatus Binataceae bacterium]
MKTRRSRLIAAVTAMLTVAVVLLWLFAAGGPDTDDDEDQVTATTPILSHASNGDVVVTLKPNQQTHINLRTAMLAPVNRERQAIAYGVILDPVPLAALDARLASDRAALEASRAEFTRAQLLHSEKQNVSLKEFQSARATFQSGQVQLNLLNQRMADEWGSAIAAMPQTQRAKLIDNLISREEAIIQVSIPARQSLGQAADSAEVTVLGAQAQPLLASAIWPAPSVDPNLQGQGFLMRVKTQGFPLRPGAAVSARLESSSADRGVVVPSAAVVRTGEAAWAYVQVTPTQFERRRLAGGTMTAGGWFVMRDFAPGDRVVIAGAQVLLSEEFKSEIQVED